MPDFHQPSLPGMPVRIIVSAVWESPHRPCTVRATTDAPSDEYASQWCGLDTEGTMTWSELQSAMETLLGAIMDQHEAYTAQKVSPSS